MELALFDEAAEVVRTMLPEEYREIRIRSRRWGMKLWFGPAQPPRCHYEAQLIGAHHVDNAQASAIEVGYHLEDRDKDHNVEVLGSLTAREKEWRRALGAEPAAGPFLGRPEDWRRLSETWPDPDLEDPDLALDIGTRMVDYVSALEPLLRSR